MYIRYIAPSGYNYEIRPALVDLPQQAHSNILQNF